MKEIVDETQDVKGRYSAAAEDRCPGQILPEGGHQHTLIKTVLHNTLLTFMHHTLFFYPECRLWASSRYGGNVNMMAV